MKVETTAYAPVRLCVDSQREWICVGEAGLVQQHARQRAEETNWNIPTWANHNPIQRIVKVKITEME